MSQRYQIAVVDDHQIVVQGFAGIFAQLDTVKTVLTANSIEELLSDPQFADTDLVILDLRLADGVSPAENVARIREHGVNVLAFTGDTDPNLVRSAAQAGVLGVVRKSEPTAVLQEAVLQALAGSPVASFEWAAAIEADPQLNDVGLSSREAEALKLYASGAKTVAVANQMGVAPTTVIDYIRRVRLKYERAGRPAHTKIDLYQRAVEDGLLQPGQSGEPAG